MVRLTEMGVTLSVLPTCVPAHFYFQKSTAYCILFYYTKQAAASSQECIHPHDYK